MGIIQNFINSIQKRSALPFNSTLSNITVIGGSNYSSIYNNPTALTCANHIANTISTLNFSLYARTKTGGGVKLYSHPLYQLVKNPNPFIPANVFYSSVVSNILKDGNAFLQKIKNESNEVIALNLLNSNSVKVELKYGRKVYELDNVLYTDDDIIHIPYPTNFNGIVGTSPFKQAETIIQLDNALLSYMDKYFKNSVGTRLAMKSKDGISKFANDNKLNELQNFMDDWHSRFIADNDRTGKPILLPVENVELLKQTSNAEADLKSLKELTEKLICRIFAVPYSVVSEDNKYGSLSERNSMFLASCIKPIALTIEKALEASLITATDYNLYFCFDYKTILETDIEKTASTLINYLNAGVLTRNEVRAKIEMSSLGELGDIPTFGPNATPLTENHIYKNEDNSNETNKNNKP